MSETPDDAEAQSTGMVTDPGSRPTQPLPSGGAPTNDGHIQRLWSHRRQTSPFEGRSTLGEGGMGLVLETYDQDLRRTVAVKFLKDSSGSCDARQDLRDRFVQEAQVTAQLDHPGVPPIHELGVTDNGRVYYVMPRLRGRSLAQVFEERWQPGSEWTLERCLGILQRVCETLAFAHSRGVLHRDVKPANVMVGDFGEVLVIDWGLARVIGSDSSTDAVWTDRLAALQYEGADPLVTSPKGTLGFMAPEQAAFTADLQDARVDVYAVGAMLYQLLARVVPHHDSLALLHQRGLDVDGLREVLAQPARPLDEVAPGTPPELVAICAKAIAPDQRRRYSDMRALADDLRSYLEVRPVAAYRTGAWVEFTKWIRRNRAVASLAGALTLGTVVASLGGLHLERERSRALEQTRDRERNHTSAMLLDSVLLDFSTLFAGPSQLDALADVRRDGDLLRIQLADLERRRDDLVRARERSDPAEAQQLSLQIGELDRQFDLLPELDRVLAQVDAFEQSIEHRNLHRSSHAEWEASWQRALAALADDPRFEGVTVPARDDLLPLGPVEPSGLWSFLLLDSADFSTPLTYARADEVGPERGIVLLLVPGGTVSLGARPPVDETRIDEDYRDLFARPNELVLDDPQVVQRTTRLEPYYLGRHEVTRAQWTIVMNGTPDPPPLPDGSDSSRLPVAQVSRVDAEEFVRRLGVALPTEAQWEAAYRAGTTGPSFVELVHVPPEAGGYDYDWRPLARFANLLDRTALDANLVNANRRIFHDIHPAGEPDDGYVYTAPVGSFEPNPFGLFDMAGNVWEWCRDAWVPGWGPLSEGEGEQIGRRHHDIGVIRGGSWFTPPDQARASHRKDFLRATRDADVGFRIALAAR